MHSDYIPPELFSIKSIAFVIYFENDTYATRPVLHTQVHQIMHIISNSYTCDHCSKTFKSKGTLRYHLFSHSPGSSYSCNFGECCRLFKNPKRLSEHKRRYHLNSENYICEYCGYHTRIKCNLTVHQRQHTGKKPYCCEYCAVSFSSSYQLNIHKDSHSAERKYCCVICGESFADSKTLCHHKTLHSTEKKYKCEICDKSYQQSAGLSRHRSWHREQQRRFTEGILKKD